MNDNNHEQQLRQWEQFQEYQKQQEKGKNKKKRGWLFGCGGCLVLLILIIIGISACTASFTGGLETNSNSNKTYKLGETAENGDLEVTVNSVENMKSVGPSVAPTYAKDTFVVADVTIKNNGNKSLTVDSNMFKIKSGNKSFDADSGASMSANQSEDGNIKNSFFLEQLNPDSTTQGKVVFDVSENMANAKNKKLDVTSSMFNTKNVTFDLSN